MNGIVGIGGVPVKGSVGSPLGGRGGSGGGGLGSLWVRAAGGRGGCTGSVIVLVAYPVSTSSDFF
ncbi:hypothetical protein MPSD_55530 [Mycobacterium pseudoshottsii JCM 15466]|nr:hypothetical protein MPSD_55530 [Mycobacterium pseudoshottsii JCM 15466]